jgi:hypothetical protein
MSASYTVDVPPTRDQGSTRFNARASYGETLAKNALWSYNSNRAHDGQGPLTKMPKGTTYKRVVVR